MLTTSEETFTIKSEYTLGYVPTPDYSQEDWDEVSDNPELTHAEMPELQFNGEGLPVALADASKRLSSRWRSKMMPVCEVRRPKC